MGDYSANMRQHFTPGPKVLLEGPYVEFTFLSPKPRQIWVGAGIGIAPFVSQMRYLAKQKGRHLVDLFHSTAEVSESGLDNMRRDANAAGINLHIYISGIDGRLDATRIIKKVPQWREASLGFCGPTAFGASL